MAARVSQGLVEAITENPTVRVSQNVVESLTADPTVRVSQCLVEVLIPASGGGPLNEGILTRCRLTEGKLIG
jgi:hypothetical protein